MKQKSHRSSGYSVHEDTQLCKIFVEIPQKPFTGAYQAADCFWSQVENAYNASISEGWEKRNVRSLQSRIHTIVKATRRLHGCIREVENLNPPAASDQTILDQAKMLLMEDPDYKKGFKFDHVWNIVKSLDAFKDAISRRQVGRKHFVNNLSSESNNPTPESQAPASPGLSQFSLDTYDDVGGSSSEQFGEVKKGRLKRKSEEKFSAAIDRLRKQSQQIMEMLKKSDADQQQLLDILRRKMALEEYKFDDKLLMRDLNSISDPNIRAYMQAEQVRILQKRRKKQP